MKRLTLPVLFALCFVGTALRAVESGPLVSVFERFGREMKVPSVTPGRVLLETLNCVSCHAPEDKQSAWVAKRRAPELTNIGQRADPAWLRAYLESPSHTTPGVAMPDVLHALPEDARREAAESLVHFLLSKKTPPLQRVAPDRAAGFRGEKLFHSVGCVACHAPQNGDVKELPTDSQPLPPRMEAKWAVEPLKRFLLEPHLVRPSGRMPSLQLSPNEAADIAHYLLRETKMAGVLECSLFRGNTYSLDLLDTIEWARHQHVDNLSLDSLANERGFAVRFAGFIQIETAGEYKFYLNSGGPSRVLLDGAKVAGEATEEDNEVPFVADGNVRLEKGWHAFVFEYLKRRPKAAFKVEWEGPGVTRGAIPASRFRTTQEVVPTAEAFVADATKAARGRELFTQMRCVACHEMKDVAEAAKAPALSALQKGGCLAERPDGKVPNYHLDEQQRSALAGAIAALKQERLEPPSTAEKLSHTLMALNCVACHKRDKVGGVSAERNAYFTTQLEDAGDEGRIPPHLEGVGDKLKADWIGQVLTQGGSVRAHLNTRMPQFGAERVGDLVQMFVQLDRKEQAAKLPPVAPEVLKQAGRQLTGTDGLSCIVCHRFNGNPGLSLQFVDLVTAPKRLNADWFARFMPDPAKYHPNTRMPSFWPEGVSAAPKILDGSQERQIAALWTYLSDGAQAKTPEGLSRKNMELIIGGDAMVYRGKMHEAGFRALAVGYPERINLAFDADELRLSLLWRGRFLNASPHWSVQGMGRIRPLGTSVVVLPTGPELATLADAKAPWPAAGRNAGWRFGGYQLDSTQRPTIFYSNGKLQVEDLFTCVEAGGKSTFQRTLTFSGGPSKEEGLYFRAAAGTIKQVTPTSWRLNDMLTVSLPAGAILRGEGEKKELLIPVPFKDGQAKLEVGYEW